VSGAGGHEFVEPARGSVLGRATKITPRYSNHHIWRGTKGSDQVASLLGNGVGPGLQQRDQDAVMITVHQRRRAGS
jgi:hypothetical protein